MLYVDITPMHTYITNHTFKSRQQQEILPYRAIQNLISAGKVGGAETILIDIGVTLSCRMCR